MTSIDELKHSIISNWRDRKNHFSITKRRLIENFLKNLILLSSSLTTMRWKSEKQGFEWDKVVIVSQVTIKHVM
jgi:hypothetical protein